MSNQKVTYNLTNSLLERGSVVFCPCPTAFFCVEDDIDNGSYQCLGLGRRRWTLQAHVPDLSEVVNVDVGHSLLTVTNIPGSSL